MGLTSKQGIYSGGNSQCPSLRVGYSRKKPMLSFFLTGYFRPCENVKFQIADNFLSNEIGLTKITLPEAGFILNNVPQRSSI